MVLQEFIEKLEDHDCMRIILGGREVYTGYLALLTLHNKELYDAYRQMEIKKIRAVPEIRHKRWKELGLMAPIEPGRMPEYSFSDLQMSLYYTVYI